MDPITCKIKEEPRQDEDDYVPLNLTDSADYDDRCEPPTVPDGGLTADENMGPSSSVEHHATIEFVDCGIKTEELDVSDFEPDSESSCDTSETPSAEADHSSVPPPNDSSSVESANNKTPNHQPTSLPNNVSPHSSISTNPKVRKKKPGKPQSRAFECALCDKTYFYKCSLKRHLEDHESDTVFPCRLCAMSFPKAEARNRHVLASHAPRTQVCVECGKRFRSESSLRRHVAQCRGQRAFECNECGKRFAWAHYLARHAAVHSGEKRHKCTVCGRAFTDKQARDNHERIHARPADASAETFSCSDCGRRFLTLRFAERHAAVHVDGSRFSGYRIRTERLPPDEKDPDRNEVLVFGEGTNRDVPNSEGLYPCSNCDRVFNLKKSRDRHALSHGQKTQECAICGKRFFTGEELEKHGKDHGKADRFECRDCGKKFRFFQGLKWHNRKHHPDPKDHECHVCHQTFDKKKKIEVHMRLHGTVLGNVLPSTESYSCAKCSIEFLVKASLLKHVRARCFRDLFPRDETTQSFPSTDDGRDRSEVVVPETEFGDERLKVQRVAGDDVEKPYKCGLCDRRYTLKSSRNRHQVNHGGVKNYACKVCPMSFAQVGSRNRHMLTHGAPKAHKCPVCGKGFHDARNMRQHVLVHSKRKKAARFGCTDCAKRFVSARNLVRHLKTHDTDLEGVGAGEGGMSLACVDCGKQFVLASDLRRHSLIHSQPGEEFECLECGSMFLSTFYLERHVALHRGWPQTTSFPAIDEARSHDFV